MGRGRIPMELIQKEKARKTTFLKRKNGLMKKVYEFSTLCGVDVCVIIYGPNFDGQGPAEPETWPQDIEEVHRIIQKYQNTTSDRRPKVYDVQEYYKDRIKKVEGEISKVHKEKLKIMYPTWDDSFNDLREEQLRMFVSLLDAKIDACNQRINTLKQDPKGKAMAESDKVEVVTPYLASNPSSHLNFMPNMSQAQLFPPPMKPISDNNQLPLYPFQLGQSSLSSMLHFDQNCMQFMGKNGIVDWGDQVGSFAHDGKIDMLKDNGAETNQNPSPCYYKGNIQTMQPYTFAPQTLASQNPQHQAAFQNLSDVPFEFQLNGLYNANMLQAQMFNYMHGRK